MKKISFFVLLFLFISFKPIFAQSQYVLPYPGIMPGNKLYRASEILDQIKQVYTFGKYAKYKYHLAQSDKYLVEAKILFEYGQYLLAQKSLEKSNNNFVNLKPLLESARQDGRDTTEKELELKLASQKHMEVLHELKGKLPEGFYWQEEKKDGVLINIHKTIDEAINIRQDI